MEICIFIKYFYHILSPPPNYLTSYPPSNSCYFSSFPSKNRNQNLTRKLFSIDTFWEKEKKFFLNGVSLGITTRFQGKPYIQEQLANTKHLTFQKTIVSCYVVNPYLYTVISMYSSALISYLLSKRKHLNSKTLYGYFLTLKKIE